MKMSRVEFPSLGQAQVKTIVTGQRNNEQAAKRAEIDFAQGTKKRVQNAVPALNKDEMRQLQSGRSPSVVDIYAN